jgi:hypothetical protein
MKSYISIGSYVGTVPDLRLRATAIFDFALPSAQTAFGHCDVIMLKKRATQICAAPFVSEPMKTLVLRENSSHLLCGHTFLDHA